MKFGTKTKSLLFGMEFSNGIRRALISALALIYFLSFGFSLISITTLFAVSTIIMMFFEFPTGAIADYDSRKKSVLISLFLMSLAFLGLFLFKTFWPLAISWILADIAWTFSSGASTGWVIDTLNYAKKKSKIIGLISKGYLFEKIGRVIGGLIGLVVVAISFKFVWLIIAILYFILFLIFWKYAEEKNFKPAKSTKNYFVKTFIKAKETISYVLHQNNKNLRMLMLGGALVIISLSAFFIALPLKFAQDYGLSPQYISGIFAVLAFFAIMGPLIASRFSKTNFKNSLFVSIFIIGIAAILFSLTNNLIIALIFLVIFETSATAGGVFDDSALNHEFSSKIRASLGSFNSIIWAISTSVSVFLAGLSISFLGLTITIIFAGVFAILASLVFLFGLKEKPKNKTKHIQLK